MIEMKDQSLQCYLDALASRDATPGGGSAAAVLGAQGAALVSMVCHLTLGKAKYAHVEAEMQQLLLDAEQLRSQLTDMIKADIDVFNALMACYALPKASEEEKQSRSDRIQDVLEQATEVTLACAKACAEAIALSEVAAEKGSTAVISDAGVAVMSAFAGFKSAALNVEINVASLKNTELATAKRLELARLSEGLDHKVAAIYSVVQSRL